MSAPDAIYQLVEKFDRNASLFRSPQYNETQVRVEFINPFFQALDWDVTDSRQVIHETRVEVEESGQRRPKHPDYGFLVGGQMRFYVEAKAPHVNLRDNPDPAFQVRRYGWSAKLPASVLTDFEEFSVYDCRVRPARDDRPHENRLMYYTYSDYVDRWDDIAALFSYEAVRDNKLDEWVRGEKVRGAETVDDAFLNEMEHWRMLLAKDIALHNPQLTRRELNMAVQLIIDRIVFLRICEDRDIEPYGRLRDLQRVDGIYEELKRFFRQADAKYNSGLFHFQPETGRADPDRVTLELHVDDAPLGTILHNLYYPTSPYEFSVLPTAILGQVYERFLGKVIELSETGKADVIEKPEVRKAGGVYYTPTYIVDYIVENTVGKLVEGKTPEQVARLRILDPACGSGSFLIGAYQYLLDWHLAYYTGNNAERMVKAGRLRSVNGEYALMTSEKKTILLNNIFGVDLDPQAVEVTKLSLLLKMLEGETAATAQPRLLETDRVLPDLNDNIKWGNSLIGSDFYADKQMSYFDDEELYRVKVFDWDSRTRGFGAIMEAGGFDAVIGNPPYVRIQNLQKHQPEQVHYYGKNYEAAIGKYDIYVLFLERATHLVKFSGRVGMIVPNKWLTASYGEGLRSLMSARGTVEKIVDFGSLQVFAAASIYTCLLFWSPTESFQSQYVQFFSLDAIHSDLQAVADHPTGLFDRFGSSFLEPPRGACPWRLTANPSEHIAFTLADKWGNLGEIAERVFQGIITGGDSLFIFEKVSERAGEITVWSKEFEQEFVIESDLVKPFLRGSNVRPFHLETSSLVILHPYKLEDGHTVFLSEEEIRDKYPSCWGYLQRAKSRMEVRGTEKMIYPIWYALWCPRDIRLLNSPKILVPTIANKPSFALDIEGNQYFLGSGAGGPGVYGITLKKIGVSPLYVIGILNSKITGIFIKATSSVFRGGYYAYSRQYIEQVPFRAIDFDDVADVAHHDHMVALVERMLDLHKQLPQATGEAKKIIQAQIETTDREIDHLVYELYDLTDDEIAIVEGRES